MGHMEAFEKILKDQEQAFEKIRNHLIEYIKSSSPGDFGFEEEKLTAQEYGVVADMMDSMTEKIRVIPLE